MSIIQKWENLAISQRHSKLTAYLIGLGKMWDLSVIGPIVQQHISAIT